MQKNCQGLKVLLVDERSLIGCTNLGWMEFMCQSGTGVESKSWGGLPVVVVLGDDVQLPPVLDCPVYKCNAKSQASMHGSLIWKEFNAAVLLSTVIRQGEDQTQFKNVLSSLREYKLSSDQAKWLQNYHWDDLKKQYGLNFTKSLDNHGLFVFPTHNEEWAHNKIKLLEANEHFPVAKIDAVRHGLHSKSKPCIFV